MPPIIVQGIGAVGLNIRDCKGTPLVAHVAVAELADCTYVIATAALGVSLACPHMLDGDCIVRVFKVCRLYRR